jgi:hypothetical protein
VIFDLRANHMATHPTACAVEEIPPDRRKLALFFICSADNEHARSYARFMEEHPSYRYLEPGRRNYPEELRRIADEQELTLV